MDDDDEKMKRSLLNKLNVCTAFVLHLKVQIKKITCTKFGNYFYTLEIIRACVLAKHMAIKLGKTPRNIYSVSFKFKWIFAVTCSTHRLVYSVLTAFNHCFDLLFILHSLPLIFWQVHREHSV